MNGSRVGSPEYLAETNHPHRALRVSIAFIVIDTFFLLVFYLSRRYNPTAVRRPMLVCNTLCYLFCLGSAVAGICKFHPSYLLGLVVGLKTYVNELEVMGAFLCFERKVRV